MLASEAANRPRWRGEPGFFEIWFLVVFEPGELRAWWLRYSTFAAAAGGPGGRRATLWAAAFDASAPEPAIGVKAILPIEKYEAGARDRFAIHIGSAELANGVTRGAVRAGGHEIAWDLRFVPAAQEARRMPRLLYHLPLPTHVAHANSDIACSGVVRVDGVERAFGGAPGVQKHLWGTRRVEDLFWLYCPRFEDDPAACMEATAVRPRRRLPGGLPGRWLTTIWLRTAAGAVDRTGLPGVLRNRVVGRGLGRIEFRSTSATRRLRATAWCDPRTLVGYVYRDPAGSDVHVAQSDLASCTLEIGTRAHPLATWGAPLRLASREGGALEFHAAAPLPGVRYIGWDETA